MTGGRGGRERGGGEEHRRVGYTLMDNRISVTVPTSSPSPGFYSVGRIKINSISRRKRNHAASHIIISRSPALSASVFRPNIEFALLRTGLTLMKLDVTIAKQRPHRSKGDDITSKICVSIFIGFKQYFIISRFPDEFIWIILIIIEKNKKTQSKMVKIFSII